MAQSTTQEIETQITSLKESIEQKKDQIESYRAKRAGITVNEADTQKNKAKITSIDHEIRSLQRDIDNVPAELELLEKKLADEQRHIAQAERDDLLDGQRKAAKDVELLSKAFIGSLEKSVEINSQLRAALLAESKLREKTGQQVLQIWCNGSMESLERLLSLMQYQMQGGHAAISGPGIVGSNRQIQL